MRTMTASKEAATKEEQVELAREQYNEAVAAYLAALAKAKQLWAALNPSQPVPKGWQPPDFGPPKTFSKNPTKPPGA